jgi:hypothetical protein
MPEISYLDILKVLPDKKKDAITPAAAVLLAFPTLSEEERANLVKTKVWQMVAEKLVDRYSKDGEMLMWISRYGKQRLREREGR